MIPTAAHHAIRRYTAAVRRAVWEYAHCPAARSAPASRCRAVPVRTHRGVCRRCSAAERKP